MSLLSRLVIYAFVVPCAVAIGVAVAVHRQDSARDGSPAFNQHAVNPVPPAATNPPVLTYDPGSRQITLGTPVDDEGFVTITCTPKPVDVHNLGYVMFARPGAVVRCTNGAIPAIVK